MALWWPGTLDYWLTTTDEAMLATALDLVDQIRPDDPDDDTDDDTEDT